MSWSKEQMDILAAMWADDKSAAQIAAALPGETRNAVIGMAHRSGLPARPNPVWRRGNSYSARGPVKRKSPPPRPDRPAPVRAAKLPSAKPPDPIVESKPLRAMKPAVVISAEDIGHVSLEDVQKSGGCRWPYGDRQFTYCGQSTNPLDSQDPYCTRHRRRASSPVGR